MAPAIKGNCLLFCLKLETYTGQAWFSIEAATERTLAGLKQPFWFCSVAGYMYSELTGFIVTIEKFAGIL